MSLFEKIEPERIEPEDPGDSEAMPQSSRRWSGSETLTVAYNPLMKASVLLYPVVMLPLFQTLLEDGTIAFEALAVVAVVFGVWYLGDCLVTRDFTFSADRIVKRGIFGQTVIPVDTLVMNVNEQTISFFHGTEKNIRESVKVRRFLIAKTEGADIQKYAQDVYRVRAGKKKDTAEGRKRVRPLAVAEFQNAAASYLTMAALFVLFALIAVFTAALADRFDGLMPSLPAYPARLLAICLAIAGFLLLRLLAAKSSHEGEAAKAPVEVRLKRAETAASISSITACGVAALGLTLFLLLGNMLDFYFFLLVGILYFFDFYPRLSAWEMAAGEKVAAACADGERARLPRRSLQVSLVLMGALAVTSYGETRHYLYANRQDCLNDWGDGQDCQEAPGSTTSYGTHYYYGPRYGRGGVRPIRSVGVATVSRGGFGSLGSLHASFGG